MRGVVAGVITLAVLAAYGVLLHWSLTNGHWWVIALSLATTAYGTYKLSSPAERKEFADEVRRLTGQRSQ